MKRKIKNIDEIKEKGPSLKERIGEKWDALIAKCKLGLYDAGIWFRRVTGLDKRQRKQRSMKSKNFAKNLFLFCVLVVPVVQFIVFYIVVNINSILLAFKDYNLDTGEYYYVGGKHFTAFIDQISKEFVLRASTKNSFILYAIGLIISMPLHVMSSFFVYKKIPLAGMFKIFLYVPSIMSSVVMTIMYKYFVDRAVPAVAELFGVEAMPNLFKSQETAWPVLIFYNIWFGLGGGIILYTGAMSRIPDSLVEYGKMEGLGMWKEFWKVTVPLIWPTITVFLVTGIAGIFTNQGGVYTFYGEHAPQYLYTYGYYLFVRVVGASAQLSDYPYASAAGLLFTLVAAPITLLAKYLLEKYGPTAEF